jgi:predicted transposase YbfD/YdcC
MEDMLKYKKTSQELAYMLRIVYKNITTMDIYAQITVQQTSHEWA